MKKKNFFYLFIFIYFGFSQTLSLENRIIYKVNNEIITTIDIQIEEKYLVIFNTSLLFSEILFDCLKFVNK